MDWIQIDGVGINAASIRSKKPKDALSTLSSIAPATDQKDKDEWAKKALEIISPLKSSK